jgi:hypothetical protein
LQNNQGAEIQFAPPGPFFNGFAHFDLNFSPNFTEYVYGQPTEGIVFAVNITSSFGTLTLNTGLGNAPGFNCHYVNICPTSGSLFVYDPSTSTPASDILTISTDITYLVGSFPYSIGVTIEDLDILPAVPEPSTWAMLLIGFAAIGFASLSTQPAWMKSRRESFMAYYKRPSDLAECCLDQSGMK